MTPDPSESANQTYRVSMAPARYGCAGNLEVLPATEPHATGHRVEYRRTKAAAEPAFVDCYVNGPLGLEQGFTLPASPCGKAGRISIQLDDASAAYPITVDPLLWTQQQKLLPSDGAENDIFGASVAVNGDTAVIGAPSDDDQADSSGAAYVFVRSGNTWTQQQKLLASDGGDGSLFGFSVAVEGDTALIGARGGPPDTGAVYVFTRSGNTWTEQQKLGTPDPWGPFGASVALSGDTAAIAAMDSDSGEQYSGSVHVFVNSGGIWSEEQRLFPDDWVVFNKFGWAIAIDGDTVAVGAPGDYDPDIGTNLGSVYVFTRSAGAWTQQQQLFQSDVADFDYFGGSVAISGDTIAGGAPMDDDKGNLSGSAYIFVRSGNTWTEQQKLLASDGAIQDRFSFSIGVNGDRAIVGAILDSDLGFHSGSAYTFLRSGNTWTQEQKLHPSDGADSDQFGMCVAMTADTAIFGVQANDDLGMSSGSAYVFALKDMLGNGTACAAASECASGYCVDGLCCDLACGGSDLKDCQACSVAAGATVDGTCKLLASSVVCRPAAGLCDLPDKCSGNSPLCSTDKFVSAGTSCRVSAGICDAGEACTGNKPDCPMDGFVAAGTQCRGAAGICDVADSLKIQLSITSSLGKSDFTTSRKPRLR